MTSLVSLSSPSTVVVVGAHTNPNVKTIRTVQDYTWSSGSATVDLSSNAGFTIDDNDIVEFLPQ